MMHDLLKKWIDEQLANFIHANEYCYGYRQALMDLQTISKIINYKNEEIE